MADLKIKINYTILHYEGKSGSYLRCMMNIEVLKPENEHYLEQYKVIGYKSKSDLINEALEMHRKRFTQRKKREELLLAGIEYAKDNGYVWAGLDGEDFEG